MARPMRKHHVFKAEQNKNNMAIAVLRLRYTFAIQSRFNKTSYGKIRSIEYAAFGLMSKKRVRFNSTASANLNGRYLSTNIIIIIISMASINLDKIRGYGKIGGSYSLTCKHALLIKCLQFYKIYFQLDCVPCLHFAGRQIPYGWVSIT